MSPWALSTACICCKACSSTETLSAWLRAILVGSTGHEDNRNIYIYQEQLGRLSPKTMITFHFEVEQVQSDVCDVDAVDPSNLL